MVDPHPGSIYTIRGGGLATRLYTSIGLTALHYIANEYHLKVSIATFKHTMSRWGFIKNHSHDDTPQLPMRISASFYLLALEDDEMLVVLKNEGMYTTTGMSLDCIYSHQKDTT